MTNRVADDAALAQMASTLVAALIREDVAWIANLGDSRAYLFSGGELEQLTQDDSFVAEQVRAGILSPEQAERSPYQNVITRSIGVDQDITEIPVIQATLPPGSMLLLCSDGLFRPLELSEIALVLRHGSLEEITRQLIDRANATVVRTTSASSSTGSPCRFPPNSLQNCILLDFQYAAVAAVLRARSGDDEFWLVRSLVSM